MPIDSPGVMAQAMAPTSSARPAAQPANTPAGSPAAATPSAPPPSNTVPSDYFQTIGPQLNKALGDLQSAENEPEPTPPPFQLFQPPPPKVTQYNPLSAWGSTAMFLAGLGSLFTRTPLTSALNAAAGVMNSYKQADAQQTQQNLEAWKTQTANFLNQQKFELDAYSKIMSARSNDIKAATAEVSALAGSLKDAPVLAALQTGGVPAVMDLLGKRKQAATSLADVSGQLVTFADEQTRFMRWQQDNPKPADPAKQKAWAQAKQQAALAIFGGTIQNHNNHVTDPGDKIVAGGWTLNQYVEAARTYMATGQKPDFGDGKIGTEQKAAFDQTVLALEYPDGPSGNQVLPQKAGKGGASTALSDTTVRDFGIAFAHGVPMNKLLQGMGNTSADERAQIINYATDYLAKQGKDASALISSQTDYEANSKALDLQVKAASAASGYEATVHQNMQTALDIAKSGNFPTRIGPFLNRIIERGYTGSGDPQTAAFAAALTTVANEYAKVMSGGTASISASSDSSRKEAEELLSKFFTMDQISSVFDVMNQDMSHRMQSYQNVINSLNQALSSGSTYDTTADDGAPAAPNAPATTGSINGVTYKVSQ